MIQIIVTSPAAEGKSSIAAWIATALRAVGINAFHDSGEDGPIPPETVDSRLSSIAEKRTPVTIVEVQPTRAPEHLPFSTIPGAEVERSLREHVVVVSPNEASDAVFRELIDHGWHSTRSGPARIEGSYRVDATKIEIHAWREQAHA